MTKTDTTQSRGSLTLAELLEQDTHAPFRESDYPHMTVAVRDWLNRFITDQPNPPVSEGMNNPDAYHDVQWVCAVLDDPAVTVGDNLPGAAVDHVYQYLQALEEETDVHIWNEGQVARAALPIMIDITSHSDSSAILPAVKAAFALHCTQQEIVDFLKRHGIRDSRYVDDDWEAKMMAGKKDYNAAMDAAHILGNEENDVPEELRGQLMDAINHLSTSTGVSMWHPALIERALTIMFESMAEPLTGNKAKYRRCDYEAIHALIARIQDVEEPERKEVSQGGKAAPP